MERWPRITIVTPSYNQGRYIAETIESVLAQNYPNLEHIVIDGGSTDETLDVLKRYPHLIVVSEPDRGQSDAINKGFRLATGEILGYLCSDDTLLPGALHRVAREIDPARGRHVVMGRCLMVDEHGRSTGIEHPSRFEGHLRVLEVWKGHTIPQPAVFWTREVWERCGGMDVNLKYHMDYDLFCRMSRYYRFHFIDQVLATYRLHPASKTEAWSEAERLEDCIRISRRYWGSPLCPKYWRLAVSLAWYRLNRRGRARGLYTEAQEAKRHRRWLRALLYLLAAGILAPEVAFYVAIYPKLRRRAGRLLGRFLDWVIWARGIHPQTAAYMNHVHIWNDGWVGPRLVLSCQVGPGMRAVVVRGEVDFRWMQKPQTLTLSIDGVEVGQYPITQAGPFTARWTLPEPLSPGRHDLEICAGRWFVHHRFSGSGDYRPLAWRAAPQNAVIVCLRGENVLLADHASRVVVPSALVFTAGWYDVERSGPDWVRWTAGRGEIRVLVQEDTELALHGELCSVPSPNTVDVIVNGRPLASIHVNWEGFGALEPVRLHLKEGENVIELLSRNAPITLPTDNRSLAIAVKNVVGEIVDSTSRPGDRRHPEVHFPSK